MARDDYYVLAYKVLAYLYHCLKNDSVVDVNYVSHEALGIGIGYWEYLITHLDEDGYIEGVSLLPILGRNTPAVKVGCNLAITPRGIDFLENNSTMSKAKRVLKELNELIPGL